MIDIDSNSVKAWSLSLAIMQCGSLYSINEKSQLDWIRTQVYSWWEETSRFK